MLLLTARHCTLPEGSTTQGTSGSVADGGNSALGTWSSAANRNSSAHDATLITPTSGQVGASVYNGGVTSATSVKVTGVSAGPSVGGYVFDSGAMSGAHVLKVLQTGVSTTSSGVTISVTLASAVDGGLAVARGDSGGPVIYASTTSTTSGAGTGVVVSGLSSSVYTCPGGLAVTDPNIKCYHQVMYSPLQAVLTALGATLHV